MAPKGPEWKFMGPIWIAPKGHLGVFGPQKWRSKKKLTSLLGALGARCAFFPGKNACRQKGPLGSKGALGGAFGTLGPSSGPFSRFLGVAGASRFAPWGAQGPPEDRFKNSKSVLGGPLGAPMYV